jgi:hypothetical protein
MASTQSPTCTPSEFPSFAVDHRQVRILVYANNFRGVLVRIAVQLHLNLGGLLDHVIVGQDVAALVDNYARAEATLRLRRCILASVEKPVEEVLHRVVLVTLRLLRSAPPLGGRLALENLCSSNIHYRRLNARHNGGE